MKNVGMEMTEGTYTHGLQGLPSVHGLEGVVLPWRKQQMFYESTEDYVEKLPFLLYFNKYFIKYVHTLICIT